jgi:hypothetical protein
LKPWTPVAQVPFSRQFHPSAPAALSERPGFVSSNELKRTLKLHGADLSQKDMEALATQVFLWRLPS